MDQQPRYEPQAASAFFYDGAAMRPPVEGTVARGELRDDDPYWSGKDATGAFVAGVPAHVEMAGMTEEARSLRGQRRYDIYCAACHDQHGDGTGILFERGKVPTPSFHIERIRQMPDGQIFDIITNGVGLMPAYRYPIPVADRWAIVSHVRALQARRAARQAGQPLAAPVAAPTTTPAEAPAAPADTAPPAAPEPATPPPPQGTP